MNLFQIIAKVKHIQRTSDWVYKPKDKENENEIKNHARDTLIKETKAREALVQKIKDYFYLLNTFPYWEEKPTELLSKENMVPYYQEVAKSVIDDFTFIENDVMLTIGVLSYCRGYIEATVDQLDKVIDDIRTYGEAEKGNITDLAQFHRKRRINEKFIEWDCPGSVK